MKEKTEQILNRRGFLKLGGTGAALAVMGNALVGGKKAQAFKKAAPRKQAKEEGWYPSLCKMCMQGDCVTRMKVVDGVVVKVEGDPRAPNNAGRLCPRGNGAIVNLYNPWRVKAPLKRTNPKKGLNEDPGFVEISWDEAISTCAEKMDAVRKTDPRKFVLVSGFGQIAAYITAMLPFMATYGSPNDVPSRGQACAYHFFGGLVHNASPDSVIDMDLCEYVINVGRSMGPNYAIASSGSKVYVDAIERGCKVVVVDPRSGPEASKAYMWVPIRPGTDLAFLLGMTHVLLHEIGLEKLDIWAIKNRTNAPYLIKDDGEYLVDEASGKPLVWDEVAVRARPFDEVEPMTMALTGRYDVKGQIVSPALQVIMDTVWEYSPEWAEGISSVPAATIRRLSKEFVEHAKIGATIEIDGFTFPFRPVGIQVERGAFQHPIEGPWAEGVSKILQELVGCMEVPGGCTSNQPPQPVHLEPDVDGVKRPTAESIPKPWVFPPDAIDSRTFYPVSHTLPSTMCKAILDPQKYHIPYDVEVILSGGGNPIRANFDRDLFEKAYAKVPFSFALALTLDETAIMSDIVLPEDAFLERDNFEFSLLTVMQPHKVMTASTRSIVLFPRRDASKVRKPYNTGNCTAIFMDLAEKMGFLTGEGGFLAVMSGVMGARDLDLNKRPTLYDIGNSILHSNYRQDLKLEDVNDELGPIYKYTTQGRICKENYNYFYWPDNTTRLPMYMIQLLRVGRQLKENMKSAGVSVVPGWTEQGMEFYWKAFQPLPKWVACPEFDAHNEEFDMWALNWKTPMCPFYCGDTLGNVWMHDTMTTWDSYEYAVWMNAGTAAKKGLKDGDTVVVESRHGTKTQGRLKATHLIHPEAIGVPGNHGARSMLANPIVGEGPNFNTLCSIDESKMIIDPISGGIEEGPAVKVYKA